MDVTMFFKDLLNCIFKAGQSCNILRIQASCGENNIRVRIEDKLQMLTSVEASLGRECRAWPDGTADVGLKTLIGENSRPGCPVIFTDGSVQEGVRSTWAFTARVDGTTVQEESGRVNITTSSLCMETRAITEALMWIRTTSYQSITVVTDSITIFHNI